MEDKHCLGCGVLLQDINIMQEGYTTSLENDLCRRCFRMKNYGEYTSTTKTNEEYVEILKSINETDDLVLHIVDVLNIDKDLSFIRQYINNKMILVINKKDILPKSVKDEKIIEYINSLELDYEEVIIISAKNNYNIDYLYNEIIKKRTSKNVYIIGHTNTGKSSLINSLIKAYSVKAETEELTISPLPSTTLDKIEIKINGKLTLIDTPGLIDRTNIVNYIDTNLLKKISPKKEIKPRTYQLKKNQCLIIGNFARIDYVEGEKNSFTVYVSNDLKIKRMNALRHEDLKDLYKTTYELKYYEDIVINGLGFIKVVEKAIVDLYLDKNIESFVRKNLI